MHAQRNIAGQCQFTDRQDLWPLVLAFLGSRFNWRVFAHPRSENFWMTSPYICIASMYVELVYSHFRSHDLTQMLLCILTRMGFPFIHANVFQHLCGGIQKTHCVGKLYRHRQTWDLCNLYTSIPPYLYQLGVADWFWESKRNLVSLPWVPRAWKFMINLSQTTNLESSLMFTFGAAKLKQQPCPKQVVLMVPWWTGRLPGSRAVADLTFSKDSFGCTGACNESEGNLPWRRINVLVSCAFLCSFFEDFLGGLISLFWSDSIHCFDPFKNI